MPVTFSYELARRAEPTIPVVVRIGRDFFQHFDIEFLKRGEVVIK